MITFKREALVIERSRKVKKESKGNLFQWEMKKNRTRLVYHLMTKQRESHIPFQNYYSVSFIPSRL